MENLKIVINSWQEGKEIHYIVSEGTSKTTGKEKKTGQKVKFIPETGDYLCSCSHPLFTKQEKDCSHIQSLKYFQNELETKGEEVIPEKREKIEDLKKKIGELEAVKEVQFHEQEALSNQIRTYHSELEAATEKTGMLEARIGRLDVSRKEQIDENEVLSSELAGLKEEYEAVARNKRQLEENITSVEREKDTITAQLNETIEEKDTTINNLAFKEEELGLTIEILKEELDKKKKEHYAAQTVIDGFKRAKSPDSNGISSEFESFAAVLSAIPEEVIIERLCDEIYGNIPDSGRECQDKIQIGNCEHGEPKQFREFIARLSTLEKIDQINSSFQCSDKKTHVKRIYAPGTLLPSNQTTDAWTLHMVYSKHKKGTNLYVKITARNDVEAKVVARVIEDRI